MWSRLTPWNPSAPITKSHSRVCCSIALAEPDTRPVGVQAGRSHVLDIEVDLAALVKAGGDQVFDHLLLAVDGDPAAGEFGEVDAVPASREAQFGAVVRKALGVHPFAHAGLAQSLGGAVLENSGADAVLDIVAVAPLEDDGFDPLQVQQLAKHQTRGAGAHDAYLGPHLHLLVG